MEGLPATGEAIWGSLKRIYYLTLVGDLEFAQRVAADLGRRWRVEVAPSSDAESTKPAPSAAATGTAGEDGETALWGAGSS